MSEDANHVGVGASAAGLGTTGASAVIGYDSQPAPNAPPQGTFIPEDFAPPQQGDNPIEPILRIGCNETVEADITPDSSPAFYRAGNRIDSSLYQARFFEFREDSATRRVSFFLEGKDFNAFLTVRKGYTTIYQGQSPFVMAVTNQNSGDFFVEVSSVSIGEQGHFTLTIECMNECMDGDIGFTAVMTPQTIAEGTGDVGLYNQFREPVKFTLTDISVSDVVTRKWHIGYYLNGVLYSVKDSDVNQIFNTSAVTFVTPNIFAVYPIYEVDIHAVRVPPPDNFYDVVNGFPAVFNSDFGSFYMIFLEVIDSDGHSCFSQGQIFYSNSLYSINPGENLIRRIHFPPDFIQNGDSEDISLIGRDSQFSYTGVTSFDNFPIEMHPQGPSTIITPTTWYFQVVAAIGVFVRYKRVSPSAIGVYIFDTSGGPWPFNPPPATITVA